MCSVSESHIQALNSYHGCCGFSSRWVSLFTHCRKWDESKDVSPSFFLFHMTCHTKKFKPSPLSPDMHEWVDPPKVSAIPRAQKRVRLTAFFLRFCKKRSLEKGRLKKGKWVFTIDIWIFSFGFGRWISSKEERGGGCNHVR